MSGRWRGGKRGPRGGGGGGGKRSRGNERDTSWVTFNDKQNDDFEEYYRAQDIVPEGEWDAFLACLRKQLPVTFRINGSGRFADHLRDKLQSDFFSHFSEDKLIVDGEPVQPPRPLPWYPNNYAWHMDFSRGQLRKMPLLEDIHKFMVKANDVGSISRQEAVSMVPPLFLDVRPHHRVLDMCAAPGSKTFQLLEALHAGPEQHTGFVVANDADFKRCSLLTHQTKRVCSPCLMVTNHSAEFFPILKDSDGKPQRFDRILCDVPCSGDGTMRKAPDIWRRWSVGGGNGLHILQLRIALHACRLLEVGGLMVYSTCTFNPIEDEAVVAEVLKVCGGAVELVDVSDHLPALKRLPGKHTWKVKDKFRWFTSWDEAKDSGHKLDPSMFPSEEKAKFPMERCMRFLPHHQDTGGFFVCVLRKVGEVPEFELPQPYRPSTTSGMRGTGCSRSFEDPLASAKEAAVAAVDAAEAAVNAAALADAGASLGAAQKAATMATDAADALAHHRAQLEAQGMEEGEEQGDGCGDAMEEDRAEEAKAEEKEDAADAKTEEAKGEAEGAPADAKGGPSWIRGGGGRGRAEGGRHRHIDPVIPVEDSTILQPLVDYYGLRPDFPLHTQLIARSSDNARPKRLYYVTKPLLDLLVADEREQFKVIALGLKVFERQEMKEEGESGDKDSAPSLCSYRIAQEGLPLMLPFITKQRVELGQAEFLTLLKERVLLMPNSEQLKPQEGAEAAAADSAPAPPRVKRIPISDPALLAAVEGVRHGCVVCELRPADALALGLAPSGCEAASALTAYAPMALSAWKGKASLAIMVDKSETTQMVDKIEAALKRQSAPADAEAAAPSEVAAPADAEAAAPSEVAAPAGGEVAQ